MELSIITQSFCCWGKQSAHLFIYEIRIVSPHLHICLHQISPVILLPTQSSIASSFCNSAQSSLLFWINDYLRMISKPHSTPPFHVIYHCVEQHKFQYRFSCRIPLTISLHHEESPFAPTLWFLSFNKFIHTRTFPLATWLLCFLKSFWWRTLLKAFWKFK